MHDNTRKTMQQDLVAKCRRESCIGHHIPLGMPAPFARAEFGLNPGEYFARKHARGLYGEHYPLHQCQYRRSERASEF